jgi:hypothetical protein
LEIGATGLGESLGEPAGKPEQASNGLPVMEGIGSASGHCQESAASSPQWISGEWGMIAIRRREAKEFFYFFLMP